VAARSAVAYGMAASWQHQYRKAIRKKASHGGVKHRSRNGSNISATSAA